MLGASPEPEGCLPNAEGVVPCAGCPNADGAGVVLGAPKAEVLVAGFPNADCPNADCPNAEVVEFCAGCPKAEAVVPDAGWPKADVVEPAAGWPKAEVDPDAGCRNADDVVVGPDDAPPNAEGVAPCAG